MNDRDSELVMGQFIEHGYRIVDNPKKSDVILINTCSVRAHAEDRVFSFAGTLKKLKPNPVIGIIGCMATNLKKEIVKRLPYVDLVVGPNDLSKIYDFVREIQKDRQHIVVVSAQQRDRSFYKHLHHQDKNHCFVNISEGCSNFCSYCIVPYVRGRHRSRPLPDILKEIKQLVKGGVSSITLLGQNVNDYQSAKGKRKLDFINLLDMISNIKGLKEISFVTSHPKDIDERLFDIMAKKPNVSKYLHLPIQSGSNKILKAMNRKYTRERYLKIIQAYRKKVPKGILATDIIVGFPNETKKDFKQTLDLVKRVKFNFAYIFKYSQRPHTRAQMMKDNVQLEEKKKRHRILLETQRKIAKKLNRVKQGYLNIY